MNVKCEDTCKCKSSMAHLGKNIRTYNDSTIATSVDEEIYYCKKCGRAKVVTDKVISWIEHTLLPKPRVIRNPVEEWCSCNSWKDHFDDFSKPSQEKIYFCPFCANRLSRQRTEY
jgi:predicted SprT family Zn-dependent metalloprotease